MALIAGISKVVDAIGDPLVANMSDKFDSKYVRRIPFMRISAIPYALSVVLIFYAPFSYGSILNALWVAPFLLTACTYARRFADIADNIYRFTPIDLNNKQFKSIHSDNECININNVEECVRFYKDYILINNSKI